MSDNRETALLDVQTAVGRLAEADEILAARLGEAIERACAAATATWPSASEPQQTPDAKAIARVSGPLACFARCLPIALEGDTLVVLAAEPLDLQALRLLEAHAGSVRVVTAPAELVWRGLESAYGGTAKKSRKKGPQPLSSAAEPEVEARTAGNLPANPEISTEDVSETPLPQPLSAAAEPVEGQVIGAQERGASVATPLPVEIPPDADLLAAFEGVIELPAAQPQPVNESVALGADDIAALFSAAEASASPVEPEPGPEPEPAAEQVRESDTVPSLESQFDELMAEVQNNTAGPAEPTDIHEPRTQNLDLLSAFEGLSEPVALSEKPVTHEVDVHAISADAFSDDLELEVSDDPEKIAAQVKRIAVLLHEDEGSDDLSGLVPLETALAAMCAPIAIDGDDLVCLIAEPPNLSASEAVAEAAQMALRLQLSSREKVLARLHEVYGDFEENVIPESSESTGEKESLFTKLKGKFKKAA